MACIDCEKRRKKLRDAIVHGRMAEAMETTIEGLRVMIGIDPGADHRALPALSDKTKADLLEIARSEGSDADESMTKDEITDAIKAKREAAVA